MRACANRSVAYKQQTLENLAGKLDMLSPLSTLKRGYAIATRDKGQRVILDAKELKMETGGTLPLAKQGNDIAQSVLEKFEQFKNTKNKYYIKSAGNELYRYWSEVVVDDPYNLYQLLLLTTIKN